MTMRFVGNSSPRIQLRFPKPRILLLAPMNCGGLARNALFPTLSGKYWKTLWRLLRRSSTFSRIPNDECATPEIMGGRQRMLGFVHAAAVAKCTGKSGWKVSAARETEERSVFVSQHPRRTERGYAIVFGARATVSSEILRAARMRRQPVSRALRCAKVSRPRLPYGPQKGSERESMERSEDEHAKV